MAESSVRKFAGAIVDTVLASAPDLGTAADIVLEALIRELVEKKGDTRKAAARRVTVTTSQNGATWQLRVSITEIGSESFTKRSSHG